MSLIKRFFIAVFSVVVVSGGAVLGCLAVAVALPLVLIGVVFNSIGVAIKIFNNPNFSKLDSNVKDDNKQRVNATNNMSNCLNDVANHIDNFEYICNHCATVLGGTWPKNHVATCSIMKCDLCGDEKSCANVGDWNWSDGKRRGMRD